MALLISKMINLKLAYNHWFLANSADSIQPDNGGHHGP